MFPLLCFVAVQMQMFLGIPVTEETADFGEMGIYSATENGAYSPTWNPANCAFAGHRVISIEASGIQVSTSTTEGIEAAKPKIMSSMESGWYTYRNILEKRVISIGYRTYAFTHVARAYHSSRMREDFYSFTLYGNEVDSIYDFSGGSGTGQIVDEYGLSGSFLSIEKNDVRFSSGIRLKYLEGISFINMDSTCGIVQATWDTVISTSALFFSCAEGGRGFGIDAGIAGYWHDILYGGICVEHIYSAINWSENTTRKQLTWDEYLSPLLIEDSLAISSFKSRLPLIVRGTTVYDVGLLAFSISTVLGQYWAHSAAMSLRPCKYGSITGGVRYSLLDLSPMFKIDLVPMDALRLSLGYHRIEGVMSSTKGYRSAYTFSLLLTL